jgi:hypothetical protein
MLKDVVQQGALAANGMPQFKGLPDADAEALFAYIIKEAWDAHDKSAGKPKAEGGH